jgi:hypothetical protein
MAHFLIIIIIIIIITLFFIIDINTLMHCFQYKLDIILNYILPWIYWTL